MKSKRTTKLKNEISNGRLFYRETYSSPIGSSLFYSGLLFLAFVLRKIAMHTGRPMVGGIVSVTMLGLAGMLHIIKIGRLYT